MTAVNEMNKMNNDPQTNGSQEYEIAINVTPKTFAGLTRQGMQGQQACFEFCDNGLAAALAAESVWPWAPTGTKTTFRWRWPIGDAVWNFPPLPETA